MAKIEGVVEKIEGKVSKVRFSTDVSGVRSTHTEQVAVFELDGRPVEFSSSESIIIEDGNDCVVAGVTKNGLFKAMAFKNKTKNVSSRNNA